jgi:hypothetical protein
VTASPGLAVRTLAAGLVLATFVGACACAADSLKIDDLAFVSMRKLDPQQRAAHPGAVPHYMTGNVYDDDVFVEVTLSTSLDLVAAVQNGSWMPYSRKWQCTLGWDEGWMDGPFISLYRNGKPVSPPTSQGKSLDPNDIASAAAPVDGRQFYAVYFKTKVDASSHPRGHVYDLVNEPADVCIEFAEAGYYGSTSLKSNVVTIPAEALRTLLGGGHRQ